MVISNLLALAMASHTHKSNGAVDKPSTLNFDSVRKVLMRIVPLCLDRDPSLIPLSCRTSDMHESLDTDAGRDPDDFSFWSERQARRICDIII